MENITDLVLPIIKKTREILLPHWGKVENVKYKDGQAHSVVTELDKKVEKFLYGELNKVFPDIVFVGEEFGGDRTARKFWLADPIDGTSHFVRGLPFCTTMLALIEDGQVIFSAIYDFINDVMYHAERGKGAYKNGLPIQVSNRSSGKIYLAWETHHDKPENKKIEDELHKFASHFELVCSGYEHAMVAEGKIEGRVCFDHWGEDYDYAPGTLLISEAGGIVTNIGKTSYNYKDYRFIAASPIVYKKLTEGSDAIFPLIIGG